jgi:hypothetical protein
VSGSIHPASAANVGQDPRGGRRLSMCSVGRLSVCGAGGGRSSSVPVTGAFTTAHDATSVSLPAQSHFFVVRKAQCGEFIEDRGVPGPRVEEVFGQGVNARCSRLRGKGRFGTVRREDHLMRAGSVLEACEGIMTRRARSILSLWRERAAKRRKGRKEAQLSGKNQQFAAWCRMRVRGTDVPSAVHGLVFVVDSAQDCARRKAASKWRPLGKPGEYRTVLNRWLLNAFQSHPLLLSHEKQASAAGLVTCL